MSKENPLKLCKKKLDKIPDFNTQFEEVLVGCIGYRKQQISTLTFLYLVKNKPAAQAAGADPFQCNSTNKQNLPIQQNCRNS